MMLSIGREKLAEEEENVYIILHQTIRSTISSLDSILVNLLMQGNAFVIAILSVPIVAKLDGKSSSIISFFAFVLGQFLLLANVLYRNLLTRAVNTATKIENQKFNNIEEQFRITQQLNKIPFSAEKGARFLYLVLPIFWIIAAFIEGIVYLWPSCKEWLVSYIVCCLLMLSVSFGVYWSYLKRRT